MHMHATCLTHIILLNLITVIIYDQQYKLLSSILYNLLDLPATSSLRGSHILLSNLFSITLYLYARLLLYAKHVAPK